MTPRPPSSPLFPYTTLFRSQVGGRPRRRPWLSMKTLGETRLELFGRARLHHGGDAEAIPDRKSTRLNSSHVSISYAVFCLKKKKNNNIASNRHNTYNLNNHV